MANVDIQPQALSRSSKVRVAAASLTVSIAALAGIAAHEGYVGHAYKDPVGVWTIGYGETRGVVAGQTTTRERALVQLSESASAHAKGMVACIKVPISQGEFDAYTDFTYNIGIAGFCRSSVATKLNAADYEGACAELLKFVYAKGKVLPGLVTRRKKEYETCLRS
jgi:lysozyme